MPKAQNTNYFCTPHLFQGGGTGGGWVLLSCTLCIVYYHTVVCTAQLAHPRAKIPFYVKKIIEKVNIYNSLCLDEHRPWRAPKGPAKAQNTHRPHCAKRNEVDGITIHARERSSFHTLRNWVVDLNFGCGFQSF